MMVVCIVWLALCVIGCTCRYSDTPTLLPLKRALIVSKMTRYEAEMARNPSLSPSQLESKLRARGSDYDALLRDHELHKDFEDHVRYVFNLYNVESRTVNRTNYTEESVAWADAIFPTGGDGTFLMAASLVRDRTKPVIGFNSDPARSEGHLCLPKQYSDDVLAAVQKIIHGEFTWQFRSRIRVTLCGEKVVETPVHLQELQFGLRDERVVQAMAEDEVSHHPEHLHQKPHGTSDSDCSKPNTKLHTRVLPYLALNEVFVGECLAARVSTLQLSLDGGPRTKLKSSGVCICTGTGSTSWHLSINRLSPGTVRALLNHVPTAADMDATEVARLYNKALVFDPQSPLMCYSVRDVIAAGVWPWPPGLPPRGYHKNITIISHCQDAGLVIDAGLVYSFNDPTKATLEIREEDALRTIIIH